MESLRLAYLVSQYPAVNHTFILREIRSLRQRGFQVQVVSIRDSDRPPEKLTLEEREEYTYTRSVLRAGAARMLAANVATLLTRPADYIGGLVYALRLAAFDLRKMVYNLAYFVEAVTAGRWILEGRAQHVHVHFASTVALLLNRVFRVGFSITIHGPDEFNDVVGFHMAEKIACAKFLCAISHYARSQMMKASSPADWPKIEVSPLGVNPSVFEPPEIREQSERFEIISVGRLAPAKAHRVLVNAVARLVTSGRHVHLRIVGGGPERTGLEQQIVSLGLQEHVTLEGACNQDRVLEMYRCSDAFVLASFAEGVPVVLMEAMAMEIPCVATWITGVPELIRDGQDGLLVPPSDDEALAAAIMRLTDDPELRVHLGRAGRARVLDKYNLESNVARLATIFAERVSP